MAKFTLKHTFIFAIAFLASLYNFHASAQDLLNTKVKLSRTTGNAIELLSEIETNSSVTLSYTNQVCLSKKIVFQSNESTIKFFLDQIFATCRVKYIETGNKIIITPIPLQELKLTLHGYVRDSLTGEPLIGANIFLQDISRGTVANNYGYYNLTVMGGDGHVGCSYVGYNTNYKKLLILNDTLVRFYLTPQPNLQEVSVMGIPIATDVKSTRTSTIEIPVSQIQNVPSFMGETDVIKALQLFPGVQSGNEGFSGLYVRGGGSDQNLILIDDTPVYNVDHLLGFFSVFNPDIISRVSIIKGGFPAQYGGRLSSVVDIRMLEGNNRELTGSASIGLLSSKIVINGPVRFKTKLNAAPTTYALSFRRTYYDLLASPFQIGREEKSFYYFYDLNAKINHTFSPKSQLAISTYMGKDDLMSKYNFKEVARSIVTGDNTTSKQSLNDEVLNGWGNYIVSGRWTYSLTEKLYSILTTSYSDYLYSSEQQQINYNNQTTSLVTQKYKSGIRDLSVKYEGEYNLSSGHSFKTGISYTYHRFYPGINIVELNLNSNAKNDTTIGGLHLNGSEFHTYLQSDLFVSSLLRINIGVHGSMFHTGEKKYYSLEPRISSRLLVSSKLSMKAAYSTMTQYVHLLNTANVSLPTDLWLSVTNDIKPMTAWQSAVGFEYEISKGFNISIEGYYKKLNNILDYKEGQSFFDYSTSWGDKLTTGIGESYGLEFLIHRKIGDLSGWLGYTWSKSSNQFNLLNHGNWFPANNDRRHDASLFLSYLFSPKIDAALTWSYGSGKPITLASEKYYSPSINTNGIPSSYSEYFASKNGYNLPDFHRLDLGVNFSKDKAWGKRTWSVGLMNVYGRKNPFFLYYDESINPDTNESTRSLKKFSLFPFPFPYARYTVHF